MALTGTDRGTGGNNSGATSLAITPASQCTSGALLVLCLAYDNAGANGTDPFSSITDSKGNTWTSKQNAIYSPTSFVSDGVALRIFTCSQNVGALGVTDAITVSFGSKSVVAKAWTLQEFTSSNGVPVFKTGAAGTGSNTALPSLTSSSIASGNAIVGAGAAESASTWVRDSDTTRGSWSTQQATGFGSGATGMSVISQRKITTSAGTQTFNPTLTTADCILAWISIGETLTVTTGVSNLITSGQAPSVVIPKVVVPSKVSLSLAFFTPSIQLPKIVIPPVLHLSITGWSPVAIAPHVIVPGTGQLVLTVLVPSVFLEQAVIVIPSRVSVSLPHTSGVTFQSPLLSVFASPTVPPSVITAFTPTSTKAWQND